MKIELNHDEIGEAIALYLKAKLMDKTTFTVDVTLADSLPRHGEDGPTKWKIVANATQVGPDDAFTQLKERIKSEAA
jgi:hypothetical protein